MCGFAGVIAWDEKYRVTRDTLEKMSRAIAHRGPDGEGFHLTREHEPITPDTPQVGLAFRRLAILDPDPRSNQPFHIGPLTLVFNGEIYNFRDLKSEISNLRPDYHWRTTGDTEVLLMAYEVWREKCVEKLNGMFAFAVWDEQKKELFLARDRMGQKPLYVASRNDVYAFSSEIGPLMQLDWPNVTASPWSVIEYLRWGYAVERSIYRGIGEAPPGTIFLPRLRDDDSESDEYFDIKNSIPRRDEIDISELARSTRELLMRAVRRQLVSDVPLGCFLSGGIDSSVVAACMREALGPDGPICTFSIGFDDKRYDERPYAAEVAKQLRTEHHSFAVRPDAISDLPQLAAAFGQPFADSSALPTHYLSRETRKHVKVALSGDGGDELFGGYDRYRAMKIGERLRRFIPSSFSAKVKGLGLGHPKSYVTRAARLLGSLDEPPDRRYTGYLRIFEDPTLAELVPESYRGKALSEDWVAKRYRWHSYDRDPVETALSLDREVYLSHDLLTKVDRCSMLHGLEVRSPFMDHELVQFAAGLTTDQLLKGGPKRMLREAFAKDLPDFVFKRKKMGFAVPIGEWFRGELKPMLRDNLFAADSFGKSHFNMKVVERLVDEHEQQRIDHSQRLYALLMLELWWQQQRR